MIREVKGFDLSTWRYPGIPTEEQLQAWADEAEAGYNDDDLVIVRRVLRTFRPH